MMKNVRIQLFLDFRQYNELLDIAKQKNIKYGSDSELIRKFLYDYSKNHDTATLTVYYLKQQLDKVKADNKQLQEAKFLLMNTKLQEQNEKERIKINKAIQKTAKA